MVQISVCVECFFTDFPFEERVKRIADIGYQYIEFWHPEGTFDGTEIDLSKPKSANELRRMAEQYGVTFNDFAFNSWEGSIGGSPTDKSQHEKYFEQIQRMLDFADRAGIQNGIILSGLAQKGLSDDQMDANLESAFSRATEMAEKAGVTLFIELLNSLVDHAGYYHDKTDKAVKIIRNINSPNLKLLYDIYHMQIMQGNIIDFIKRNIDIIGHFHSAGVPGRAERHPAS